MESVSDSEELDSSAIQAPEAVYRQASDRENLFSVSFFITQRGGGLVPFHSYQAS